MGVAIITEKVNAAIGETRRFIDHLGERALGWEEQWHSSNGKL